MEADENGVLHLPSDPSEYVPDTTTFQDFTLMAQAGDYTGGPWFKRFLYDESTGQPVANDNYTSTDNPGSQLFTGKWVDNLMESRGFDVSQYDDTGGVVILDVTELDQTKLDNLDLATVGISDAEAQSMSSSEITKAKTEYLMSFADADLLQSYGATLVPYTTSSGDNFAFEVKGETLYPPHMKKGNVKAGSTDPTDVYTEDYPNEREYAIFVPYNTNVSLKNPETQATMNGSIYFGPKDENDRGVYSWNEKKETEVYFNIPEYQANIQKNVQSEEVYVGEEVKYTLSDIQFTSTDGSTQNLPPMYRPYIIDTLPEYFDVTELRFTVPDSLATTDDYIYDWLGGDDKLLGLGVVKDTKTQDSAYTVLEYLNSSGGWTPIPNPKSVLTKSENGYTSYILDYELFFEQCQDFQKNHTIRINFKSSMAATEQLPGNVEFIGRSRVAGEATNTAEVNFTQLLFNSIQQSRAL
jgi:hypothetical protein